LSVEDENKRKREEKGRETQKSIKIKIKINQIKPLGNAYYISSNCYSRLWQIGYEAFILEALLDG
jgi:hypothetical protein